MIERCNRCAGKKTIIKLGNIIGTCPDCKGVGHVKSKLQVEEETKPVVEYIEAQTQKEVGAKTTKVTRKTKRSYIRKVDDSAIAGNNHTTTV